MKMHQKRYIQRVPDVYVYSRRPSGGAVNLVHALRGAGIRARRSRVLVPTSTVPCINWGDSEFEGNGLNQGTGVAAAISKLKTFQHLEAAKIPTCRATVDAGRAAVWVKNGRTVFARRDGLSAGIGIEVVAGNGELPAADFYSRYFPKTHEFRVSVFKGHVIDFIEKRARLDGQVDRAVRSHGNGWVFSHNLSLQQEDVDKVKETCVRAVGCLGLDFGAVDVLAILDKTTPRKLKKHIVCEINTAPGLESPTTIEKWVAAIKEWLDEQSV